MLVMELDLYFTKTANSVLARTSGVLYVFYHCTLQSSLQDRHAAGIGSQGTLLGDLV
jgi:hypothetical protein